MSNERVDKIEERIEQLKNQKKAILQREKEKERKSRTRKLIEMGALFEKYINVHSVEDAEKWLKEYVSSKG